MNKFDLAFLNGYIKSSLRLARKIKNAKSLEEAKVCMNCHTSNEFDAIFCKHCGVRLG